VPHWADALSHSAWNQEAVKARQQYEESTAAYRTCLAANQANTRNWEAQRLTMEADERVFTNISARAK
jgi:hypothetical protein